MLCSTEREWNGSAQASANVVLAVCASQARVCLLCLPRTLKVSRISSDMSQAAAGPRCETACCVSCETACRLNCASCRPQWQVLSMHHTHTIVCVCVCARARVCVFHYSNCSNLGVSQKCFTLVCCVESWGNRLLCGVPRLCFVSIHDRVAVIAPETKSACRGLLEVLRAFECRVFLFGRQEALYHELLGFSG